jgi:arginyl-tRNA synthetase
LLSDGFKGKKMEKDIAHVLGVKEEEIKVYKTTSGYSYPCFSLAKKLKLAPGAIAKKLETALGGVADGPYYKWKE